MKLEPHHGGGLLPVGEHPSLEVYPVVKLEVARPLGIDFPKRMLVGGLEHFLLSIIYGIILPID